MILEGILLGLGTPNMYINHVLMGHQGIEVNVGQDQEQTEWTRQN